MICASGSEGFDAAEGKLITESRVNSSPPFSHTGVDYAGPFGIIPFVGRGQTRKHYVVLFVCLATKAIHLEVVEDYTTAGFLAAFRRFVSRRALPAHMYSDNGTNFHGADRELRASLQAMRSDSTLQANLVNDGVQWHFIPPAAPHFGRLFRKPVSRVLSSICGELLAPARFPRQNLRRYVK